MTGPNDTGIDTGGLPFPNLPEEASQAELDMASVQTKPEKGPPGILPRPPRPEARVRSRRPPNPFRKTTSISAGEPDLHPGPAWPKARLGPMLSPGVPRPREDDPTIWARAIPALMADPEIRNLTSYRYHWATITTIEYRGAEQTAEHLLALLQE